MFRHIIVSLLLCGVLLPVLPLSSCKKAPLPFSSRLVMGDQLEGSKATTLRAGDADQIMSLLRSVFSAIESKDLSSLSSMVNPQRGIYTDLKVLRTAGEFTADIANPQGYVNTYYVLGDRLREHTGDAGQKSLHEVISSADQVRADLYFDGDECEVRLTILGEQAGESYRFNNPYFLKQGGKWYLYRLP